MYKKYSIIHNDWARWHLLQVTLVSNLTYVNNKQQGGNIKKKNRQVDFFLLSEQTQFLDSIFIMHEKE